MRLTSDRWNISLDEPFWKRQNIEMNVDLIEIIDISMSHNNLSNAGIFKGAAMFYVIQFGFKIPQLFIRY